jgi:hypothetical protein
MVRVQTLKKIDLTKAQKRDEKFYPCDSDCVQSKGAEAQAG